MTSVLEAAGPRDERSGRGPVRALLAALATAVVLLPMLVPAPAHSLGEEGPFTLPLATDTISVAPASSTPVEIASLVEDWAEPDLELASTRLAIAESAPAESRSRMQLSEDGTSLTIDEEGTWSVVDQELVFVPEDGFSGIASPVAITIGSQFGTRSEPAEFAVTTPETTEQQVRASAGEAVSLDLSQQDTDLAPGAQQLQLDGLPAGSTLTADGGRLVVPGQGTWELSEDRLSLSFTPVSMRLGRQPSPVRYVSVGPDGESVSAGTVSVITPVIPDMERSALYGEDIVFNLAEGQQNIDRDTLRLEPVAGQDGSVVSGDGTTVTVPEQGRWTLDRATSTVRFSPQSASVTATAPMGVTGGDGQGASSSRALLDTAYPQLADLTRAGVHGNDVVFQPLLNRGDVRPDSLRFDPDQLPAGARLSGDELTLEVPGQGTWTIALEARTVTFSPATDDPAMQPDPVVLTARGLYADNAAHATLTAQFGSAVPTLRDDEARAMPGEPVSIDLLANDTAGTVTQPLQPSTLRIRSVEAVNLAELEDWNGTRLEIPDEGVFTVSEDGVLTFEPAHDFVGRTSPIEYSVTDADGLVGQATVEIELGPEIASGDSPSQEIAGINTLLAGLMPSSPSTSVVFGTVVLLMVFAGSALLSIGSRMESDRRTWQD